MLFNILLQLATKDRKVCLCKDDMLSFIDKLFKIPTLQDKIDVQVMKVYLNCKGKCQMSAVSRELTNTIEKLSNNVEKLTEKLTKSKNHWDELGRVNEIKNKILNWYCIFFRNSRNYDTYSN